MFSCQCTKAAVAMSSHVPAAAVFLKAGFVMSTTTVETTVMKKDVVSLLKKCLKKWLKSESRIFFVTE